MTLEANVAALTTATTNLLDAVNVSKQTLDQRVADATAQANQATTNGAAQVALAANQVTLAANQAAAAASSAAAAGSSASSALAVFGTAAGLNAAQQIMLGHANTARNQAGLSAASAAAAAAASQQDLAGAQVAALHRSPNAITAAILYDTSRDSDGGAWIEQQEGKSWMREALNGAWLGVMHSEFIARMYAASLIGGAGAELVAAGTATAVGSWTAWGTGAAIAQNGSTVRLTRGTADGGAQRSFTTVAGCTYIVSLDVAATTNTGNSGIIASTTNGITGNLGNGITNYSGVGRRWFAFTATTTTSWLAVANYGPNGSTIDLSGISVREVLNPAVDVSGAYSQSPTDGRFYRLWKNLAAFSEDFTSSLYGKAGTTVAANASAGITGANTMDKLVASAANSEHNIEYVTAITVPAGMKVSVSVDVKAGELNRFRFWHGNTGAGSRVNAATGTVETSGGDTVTVTNLGGGIYRCTSTYIQPTTGNATFRLYALSNSVDTDVWTGDGTSGIFFDRFQIELGDPTSYEARTDAAVTATRSQTEVFRGNTAKFPRLAAIVAEALGVTIYDLTQPGRPLWMHFRRSGASVLLNNGTMNMSLAARDGKLFIGGDSGGGLWEVDWIADRAWRHHPSATPNTGAWKYGLALRNNPPDSGYNSVLRYTGLPTQNGNVNAVAVTVRPTAPIDPVTLMPIPTIGVAVGTGNAGQIGTVLMDDGTAVNYSSPSNDGTSVAFTRRGEVVWTGSQTTGVVVTPLQTANVSNLFSAPPSGARLYNNISSPFTGAFTNKGVTAAGNALAFFPRQSSQSNNAVNLIRENPSASGAGLAAQITGTSNSGWMTGAIQRCLLAETAAGTVENTERITNGTFDTDTTGWSAIGGATISSVSGVLNVTGGGAFSGARQTLTTVPGRAYVLTAQGAQNTANGAATLAVAGTTTGTLQSTTSAGTLSPLSISFVAAGSTVTVDLTIGNGAATGTALFDNVSAREAIADRSVRNAPSRINGTLALTAVASAAQMVAVSGFTNDASMTVELVTNGTFNTDTSGWASGFGGATLTWNAGGTMTVTNVGANVGRAVQAIATTVGRRYTITGTITARTAVVGRLAVSNTANGTAEFAFADGGGTGTLTTTFTASATTTYVSLINNDSTADVTVTWDNISVRAADAIGSAANVIQETANSADLGYGTGAWTEAAWFNVPSTGFGPANFIRNSTMAGAVVGTPGSYPTGGWGGTSLGTTNGVTFRVAGTGTEDGLPYIDFQFTGTASAQTDFFINTELTSSSPAAAVGQTWTGSAYTKLAAGSAPATPVTFVAVNGRSADAVTDLQGLTLNANTGAGSLSSQRVTGTLTLSVGGIGLVAQYLRVRANNGEAMNFTLRIGAPQLERGATVGLFRATSGTAFNGIAPISHYGAATGAYRTLGIDGNGFLASEVFNGTATSRITSSVTVNDGQWHKARSCFVPGTSVVDHYLVLDGVRNNATAPGLMGSLTNANALWTIGNNFALNAAFPGSIALVKTGTTVPTADQAAWMFAQERAMFQPGAQVTLGDTGAVVGMNYDPQLDKLLVVTAANESNFNGLVRVSNTPVPAGSYSRVFGRGGAELLARTGTNPGVDVTLPSIALRTELLRRAEDAARLSRLNQPFNFDAAASQTDFVLPPGYEAIEVSAARQDQREGASRDFVRTFDGFREGVRFNAGLAANTWVQIMGRRAA